jgi:hypothetical protein
MRSNGLPSIRISTLPVLNLDLHEGKNAWILCAEDGCGRWVEVHRGLVQVHRTEGVACRGSRQHLIFDLTPGQYATARTTALHAKRLVAAKASRLVDASTRRATAVRTLVYPPLAPAVAYLGRDRTASPAQTAGWSRAQAARFIPTAR